MHNSYIFRFLLILFLCSSYLFASASSERKRAKLNTESSAPEIVDNSVSLNFANVGQGNGIFIINNDNQKLLIIDAGSSTRPAWVEADDSTATDTIAAQLSSLFIVKPTKDHTQSRCRNIIIIVSHPDQDHINVLNSMFEQGHLDLSKIEHVYLGGNILDYISRDAKELIGHLLTMADLSSKITILSHNIPANRILPLLNFINRNVLSFADKDKTEPQKKNILQNAIISKMRDIGINNSIPFMQHIKIEGFFDETQGNYLEFLATNAYHPQSYDCNENNFSTCAARTIPFGELEDGSNEGDSTNGNSAVVRMDIRGKNYIFTGDANGHTTDRIILKEQEIRKLWAHLLLANHHGADTHGTNAPSWALATRPAYVVFSAGFNNRYYHPRFQAFYNYLMLPSIRHSITKPHTVIFQNPVIIGANLASKQFAPFDKVQSILEPLIENMHTHPAAMVSDQIEIDSTEITTPPDITLNDLQPISDVEALRHESSAHEKSASHSSKMSSDKSAPGGGKRESSHAKAVEKAVPTDDLDVTPGAPWIAAMTTKRIYTTSTPPSGENALSFNINGDDGEIVEP